MAEKRDMVQIESLEKYFGEDKERVHVLKGVSLNIPEGRSTLSSVLAAAARPRPCVVSPGLERPDGGKISIGGQTVYRLRRAGLRSHQQATYRHGVPILCDLAAYDRGGKRRLSVDDSAPS